MRIHSEVAWSIASRYSRILASETRDLAAAIDDALAEAAAADKKRLDFLDACNAALNSHFGTTYRWKLILNHNVNRLFLGSGMEVDLADMHADGLPSCREAIDAEMIRMEAARRSSPPA